MLVEKLSMVCEETRSIFMLNVERSLGDIVGVSFLLGKIHSSLSSNNQIVIVVGDRIFVFNGFVIKFSKVNCYAPLLYILVI